ncbi:hypothetical protein [Anaeroselena agilis]|uniref:CYTH domain-containing protein n=1 Tax=Anaeroselena agilis TaxID=3063788 RepID=A0ABU3NSP6_9FIRM|nr:hypothetical protein [Selenomonadales bacterium 4137-cl]
MADKIIPRWEWRTFGKEFPAFAETLKKYGEPSVKRSEEHYILSRASDENIKIREDLVDIKSLKNVKDGLEQWDPIFKEGFPIDQGKLTSLFKVFNVPVPELKRSTYVYEQFLDEVIVPNSQLEVVYVKKVRYIYSINGCAVELAETEFNGKPFQTACVEHIDPAVVMATVNELGLQGQENINYIKAMKKSVGM